MYYTDEDYTVEVEIRGTIEKKEMIEQIFFEYDYKRINCGLEWVGK